MTTIYSPSDQGFGERQSVVDRCQTFLLRETAGQYGGRLILKGGMAMRASFGSMRLTKDIDFDRDASLPIATLKSALPKILLRAAVSAGLKAPAAELSKATETTIRARLSGQTRSGEDARFELEISGRSTVDRTHVRTEIVSPPPSYGIAPFGVETYSNNMLAAMKIAASMSVNRSAPRDIYDLRDLVYAGANPVAILQGQSRQLLSLTRDDVLEKLSLIRYQLVKDELLPFIPPAQRELLNEDRWIEYTLLVARSIECWCDEAMQLMDHRTQAAYDESGPTPKHDAPRPT